MLLSVIVPTHRRRDILRQCMECLAKQRFDSAQRDIRDMEVIIVSDGPDEKTAEMVQSLSWPFELQYFAIPKSQQGVARNRAAEKARGKYCLLIGDDIFLTKDACKKHLEAHAERERRAESGEIVGHSPKRTAVLGFTTWDPTLKITPAMHWMEQSGVQFGYPQIASYANNFLPEDLQQWFTYTSNLSLPAHLLRHHPFREDVFLYGWEDVEWGRRLALAGVSLVYEPAAKGYHHHLLTDEAVWERSKKLGFSAMEMEKLVPALALRPRGWKRIAYHALALLPTYRGKHCRAFLRGMNEASRINNESRSVGSRGSRR